MALPPVQVPDWHVAPVVHTSLVQPVPLLLAVGAGQPDVGEQAPTMWHASAPEQTTAVPPVQVPVWQVSPVVQALPSSQAMPVLGAQAPVVVEHTEQPVHAEPLFCSTPLLSQVCG